MTAYATIHQTIVRREKKTFFKGSVLSVVPSDTIPSHSPFRRIVYTYALRPFPQASSFPRPFTFYLFPLPFSIRGQAITLLSADKRKLSVHTGCLRMEIVSNLGRSFRNATPASLLQRFMASYERWTYSTAPSPKIFILLEISTTRIIERLHSPWYSSYLRFLF